MIQLRNKTLLDGSREAEASSFFRPTPRRSIDDRAPRSLTGPRSRTETHMLRAFPLDPPFAFSAGARVGIRIPARVPARVCSEARVGRSGDAAGGARRLRQAAENHRAGARERGVGAVIDARGREGQER